MTPAGWRWFVAADWELPGTARAAVEEAAAEVPGARLLAPQAVGPNGDPSPAHAPWPELFDKEHAVRAATRRLMPVRAVHAGCLLVREEVVAAHGPPPRQGRFGADLAWSAEVLAGGGGYVVPGVAARAPARERTASARAVITGRLLGVAGLSAPERLWLAYLLLRPRAASRP